MSATNNWQRFEYKYIIPLPIVGALISDVLCFSKPDAYATSSGDYEVRSIYFDTHDLRLFDEKIAGVCNRKKYRVRSYEPFPKSTSKVYLEIKEKEKDVILKRRAILPLKEVEEVINGHSYKTEDPVVKEWRYNLMRLHLHPRVLLSYDRQAFMSRGGSDYRITIDSNLCCRLLNGEFSFVKPLRQVSIMKNFCVLELKFSNFMPRKISELIKKYNLRNDAFSKYCESIIYNYKLIC